MESLSRIGQVLQNLVINGIQAMQGGGRMEIMARNATVSGGDARLAPVEAPCFR